MNLGYFLEAQKSCSKYNSSAVTAQNGTDGKCLTTSLTHRSCCRWCDLIWLSALPATHQLLSALWGDYYIYTSVVWCFWKMWPFGPAAGSDQLFLEICMEQHGSFCVITHLMSLFNSELCRWQMHEDSRRAAAGVLVCTLLNPEAEIV